MKRAAQLESPARALPAQVHAFGGDGEKVFSPPPVRVHFKRDNTVRLFEKSLILYQRSCVRNIAEPRAPTRTRRKVKHEAVI